MQQSNKIVVRTWAEVIGDATHALKFVQMSLQCESNRDSGLAMTRDRYAGYVPQVTLDEAQRASDEELPDADPRSVQVE